MAKKEVAIESKLHFLTTFYQKIKESKKQLNIVSFAFATVIFLSIITFQENESPEKSNLFGRAGHIVSYILFGLWGNAVYFPVLFFIATGLYYILKKQEPDISILDVFVGTTILSLAMNVFENPTGSIRDFGGFSGMKFSLGLEFLVGEKGKIFLLFFSVVLLIISKFHWILKIKELLQSKKNKYHPRGIELANKIASLRSWLEQKNSLLKKKNQYKSLPWIQVQTHPEVKTRPLQVDPIASKEPSMNLEQIETSEGNQTIPEPQEVMVYSFKKTSPTLVEKMVKLEEIDLDLTPRQRQSEFVSVDTLGVAASETAFSTKSEDRISSLEKIEINEGMDEIVESEEVHPIQSKLIQPVEIVVPEKEELFQSVSSPVKKQEIYEEQNLFDLPQTLLPEFHPKRARYSIPRGVFSETPIQIKKISEKEEIEVMSRRLEEITKEYQYESKVVHWEKGPIVTRYELTHPFGIRVRKILELENELKLRLAVKSIRIIAPIPGKSTIGIEVPNAERENVYLGELLKSSPEIRESKNLSVILGKNISGEIIKINLNELPHLLMAGTTGSGKSVALNCIISSLIYTKSPEEVRFIMIDPKLVELTLYQNIPHLIMPVISDSKQAARALHWAVQEMETRYQIVSTLKCRDFKVYNEKIKQPAYSGKYKPLPYIVVFIDELTDLMMTSRNDVEEYITRISQKARAVGIHLVMATQRPSANVITNLIKANCPARISFHVATNIESRIILDMSGAETLLGQGDMLFKFQGATFLPRIQAPYISTNEIETIVEEAQKYGSAEYVEIADHEEPSLESGLDSNDEDEKLIEEAWLIIKNTGRASGSWIQRQMRIGYNKAANIVEILEERGFVGPLLPGAKQREILK